METLATARANPQITIFLCIPFKSAEVIALDGSFGAGWDAVPALLVAVIVSTRVLTSLACW